MIDLHQSIYWVASPLYVRNSSNFSFISLWLIIDLLSSWIMFYSHQKEWRKDCRQWLKDAFKWLFSLNGSITNCLWNYTLFLLSVCTFNLAYFIFIEAGVVLESLQNEAECFFLVFHWMSCCEQADRHTTEVHLGSSVKTYWVISCFVLFKYTLWNLLLQKHHAHSNTFFCAR